MAYDGTDYNGWQIQPNGKTVQQVMEHGLSTLLNEKVSITGAGRTDTGVHASLFVAHFDTPSFPESNSEGFLFKLNRFLPPDIVVHRIHRVPDHIHARFSATYRSYEYRISAVKPLFNRAYCHYVFGPLDTPLINRCCKVLLHVTDFTSFSKLHTDVKTNNCHVMHAEWKTVEQGYIFEIRADRFLRNMVRSLVGTLLDVGHGKLDLDGFIRIVEAKDRGMAGQSAPAQGLFLVDIDYDPF